MDICDKCLKIIPREGHLYGVPKENSPHMILCENCYKNYKKVKATEQATALDLSDKAPPSK